MNKKIIITAGQAWNDIDAYACAIAYKELCDLEQRAAEVVLPGPVNESVPDCVKALPVTYSTRLTGDPNDYNYVLVDISEIAHFSKFVVLDNVIEIYDHRWGFEKIWKEKLGEKAKIEPVGAAATLIWEEYKKAGLADKISTVRATLLYTAILSNTLNLNAQITDERDRVALKELEPLAHLPSEWAANYYNEIAESVLNEPKTAMLNDTKLIEAKGVKYSIIQTELWQSKPFIENNSALIKEVLRSLPSEHAFLTSPSISEGYNYLICEDEFTKNILTEKIKVNFVDDLGQTGRLWLRKEIMKALAE